MASGSEHFDTVVVGSGFGGAVVTHRLAEQGKNVILLERGKPYPPGSFPRSPQGMRNNFWDPTKGLFGLFDYWSFHDLDALVSSGLGGGSLIYANVLLRKDERWFVQEDLQNGGFEHWPVSRADLEPHYDRVEAMLRPQTFPLEHPPYNTTPKTLAFREASQKVGLDWFLPPLGVTFANDGEEPIPGEPIHEEHRNLHNRTRYTCRMCGECDVGCNYGAKNTLDYNYLSEAKRLGAEIRTRAEVRIIEPRDGGGYRVRYIAHDPDAEGQPIDIFDHRLVSREITTDRLVLCCGTLGTVRLLLRNRAAFPRISRLLGTRFCGNGDLLTFAMKPTRLADEKWVRYAVDPAYGPVITSAARVPDELDGGTGRGLYVEDAGFPGFATWMLHLLEAPAELWHWRGIAFRLAKERLRRDQYRHTGRSAALAELIGRTELAGGMLPLLVMGRDIPDGRMYLRHNHLRVDWRKGPSGILKRRSDETGHSEEYFNRARAICRQLAESLGAGFRDNPLWFLRRVITVHPLGGCPMGTDPGTGVVSADGEVFGYPGLYIADGSVMPGPVGPNPSLTIAALADRFAEHMLDGAPAAPDRSVEVPA